MRSLLAVFGLLILIGCAPTVGGNFLGVNTVEDAGTLPADYQLQAVNYIKGQLRDPYSAVINVGQPFRGQCAIGIYGDFNGWAVPVAYNAKNGFGGYVGEQVLYVWFANGIIKRISGSSSSCP